jgi:hypothetical protein
MKKLILSLAFLASFSAFAAERTYTDKSGNTAVLTDSACTLKMFKHLPYFDKLKAATITIDGKVFKVCYLEEGGVVTLGGEEGVIQVPSEAFH